MCGDFFNLCLKDSFGVLFCSMKRSLSIGEGMCSVRARVNNLPGRFVGDGISAAMGAAVHNTKASGHG